MSRSSTIRNRVLTAWAHFATRRPWLVLIVCLLLSSACIALTINRLEFHSDRSDLVDPSLPWQQRYAEYKRQFPHWNDAIVVIDRRTARDSDTAEAFIRELETRLTRDPSFTSIIAGYERAEVPPTLLLTQPIERVQRAASDLGKLAPVFASPDFSGLLSLSLLSANSLTESQRDQLAGLLERAGRVASGDSRELLGVSPLNGVERLTSATGNLSFILVGLKDETEGSVNALTEKINSLRAHLREIQTDSRFAGIEAGVTGIPILESDETAQSMEDATLASILSLALIALLLVFHYRGIWSPLLAIVSLLIGVAWSFGWVTISVGHLQVLSIVFAILLLGLGIDIAIHMIARLELVHPDHDHMASAIAQVFRGVGPGVLTGSLTTAAAFGATALTDFAGVAEMGIIAAGGIILCTISVMTCFPALLMILPKPEARIRARAGGESKPSMGRFGRAITRHPGIIATSAGVVFGLAVWAAIGIKYDPDLLKLMPRESESVRWEERIVTDDARSVWHSVVLAKTEPEARKLTEMLSALPAVSELGGAGSFLQSDAQIAAKREVFSSFLLPAEPESTDVASRASELQRIATRIADSWRGRDDRLAAAAENLAGAADPVHLSRVIDAYQDERAQLASVVRDLQTGPVPDPTTLPPALRSLFIGRDGSYLLRIYPAIAEDGTSVLSPQRLTPFATSVLQIAPSATGPSIQIYESTNLILDAYLKAMLLAFGAIVVLLLIDLRSLRDTIASLLPVFMGGALLLAIMRLTGMSLNFANTIVMPLLLGLGVDAGVHAVHRWRAQPHDIPAGLAGGTGRAITLTTLTTVIGFACMIIARHQGIRSLGIVMSMGMGLVWLSAIVALPPVLRLRTMAMNRKAGLIEESAGVLAGDGRTAA